MGGDDRVAQIEKIEIDLFVLGLERAFGLDLGGCSPAMVRGAILEQVNAMHSRSVTALLDRVLHDTECGERVAACVATSGLELFAHPEFFRALRVHAMPWLRTCPFVNVWMCEPGSPGDVHSLAIVLSETGIDARSRIYATHRDGRRVAWSSEAAVSERSLDFSDPQYRLAGGSQALHRYFELQERRLVPAKAMRQNILWAQYDASQGAPFHEFNLIVCRDAMLNALPATARRHFHMLLADSQALSGLLALPPNCPLDASVTNRYRMLDAVSGLYQRVR